MQEHQDTGDPLILPNDIRLLQDHNGQKPHDVAAAFYEEVPEVWEHLKLVRSHAPPPPLVHSSIYSQSFRVPTGALSGAMVLVP